MVENNKSYSRMYIIYVITITTLLIVVGIGLWFNKTTTPHHVHMTQLEEPTQVDDYWITHEFYINEEQTLFYGPDIIRHENKTYINGQEIYLLQTQSKNIFKDYNYKYVDEDFLNLLFKGE